MENRMDLRVIKTKNSIKKAFKEMICEMDIAEITVKDLADRAMIHRKTFYLHYSSIESLFEEMAQDAIDDFNDHLMGFTPEVSIDDIGLGMMEFLSNKEPYLDRMFCSPSCYPIVDRVVLQTVSRNSEKFNVLEGYSQEEKNMIYTFVSSTALSMYRRWEVDGRAVSLKRWLSLTMTLLFRGLAALTADAGAGAERPPSEIAGA